jgi:type I restriction enzyme S subunit
MINGQSFRHSQAREEKIMWSIEAELDRETGQQAGADGIFQVIGLEDDEGSDLTDLIDQGRHFNNMDELKQAILKSISERLTVTEV